VVRAFRYFKFKEIPLAGIFVIFGYLWFVATTSFYFFGGIRLCFPAIVILLSLGDWAAASMPRRYILAGLFMVLGVVEMALVGAGYAVL
jgi:hypothetical protein